MPVTVVWRETVASRRRSLVEVVILIAVISVALFAGYHIASERSQARQQAVVQDIDDSIKRIESASRIDERRLANLAGRPCADIQAELTLRDVFVPYRRSAMMVQDAHVYCATLLGSVSIPLTAYLSRTAEGQQTAFLAGTPLMPGVPVMAMWSPVDDRRGILYIVEGAYVADILARAKASGAKRSSVSDSAGGTITNEGRFLKSGLRAPGTKEILVHVDADTARLRADLILTETFALLVGLTVCAVLLGGYHAGFTPRQRLERQVRTGLRRNEFYVEYQAIVAPLTDFVLATALAELESCGFPEGFRVNVNLAPKHIEMHCFPHDLAATLRQKPIRFQVVLEITERGLLNGMAASQRNLMTLKNYGVK